MLRSLVFLGTSGGAPTQERNVSSVCVTHEGGKCWMFDCGEGTLHQVVRCKHVKQGRIRQGARIDLG